MLERRGKRGMMESAEIILPQRKKSGYRKKIKGRK